MSYSRIMKSSMVLLALALASVVAADPLDQLRLVCAGKKVELTKASELAALVGAAASKPGEAICTPRIHAGLVELDDLINSKNDNVCSPAHIDRIRAYYKKFVDKRSIDSQDEEKLPRALKHLFLSYGFGVSRVCKTSLISSLLTDGRNKLDAADLEQISALTSDNSPLAKIVETPKDVDDIVLPSELAVFLLEKNRINVDNLAGQDLKTSIVLQSQAAHFVKRIQSLCARKFEPIYGELVLPLISLSRIGLNYKVDKTNSEVEGFRSNEDIHQWYRIVYLCELVRIVEVFEGPAEATQSDDKRVVRVLTSDEAKELRLTQPASEILGDKVDFQVASGPRVDDLIFDKQDKTMTKLVSKFDEHKSEMRRLRSMVVRQTLTLAKKFLKHSNLKLVGNFLKKGPANTLNDQLDKIIGDYIRRVSEQENTREGGHSIEKRDVDELDVYEPVGKGNGKGKGKGNLAFQEWMSRDFSLKFFVFMIVCMFALAIGLPLAFG